MKEGKTQIYTDLMDPFDGSDDPFKGSDVFGHALNDFDIWGDDEDFNAISAVMKEFPNDDFTVRTVSSSDRSSCVHSPNQPRRRLSRSGDPKTHLNMRTKVAPNSTEPTTRRQGQGSNESSESNEDSNHSNREKQEGRTRPVRRSSAVVRRRSTKLVKDASMRNLVALLHSSDPNLNHDEDDEGKELSNGIAPVVSKSIHHTRGLRVKSKSSRLLSDQTNNERTPDEYAKRDGETTKVANKQELSPTVTDELRSASSRQLDSARSKLSRTSSVNRRIRPALSDELRSASSRHLDSSRPRLMRSTKSASFAVRRGRPSSTTALALGDSDPSLPLSEDIPTQDDNVETIKADSSRRNLRRSTSSRRKPPSRNASNTKPLGDSDPALGHSDPSLPLSENIPTQGENVETIKADSSRRNMRRSTSSRHKPPSRNASHTKSLGDSDPSLSLSENEVFNKLQSAANKQEPSRGSLTRSSSGRQKLTSTRTSQSGKRLESIASPHGSEFLQSTVPSTKVTPL